MPQESDWREDLDLLAEEVDRCAGLLAELAQRPRADSGEAYNLLPVQTLLELAAEPYWREDVTIDFSAQQEEPIPRLPRDPAVLHGLGTLVQNATQFARSKVTIHLPLDQAPPERGYRR